MSKRGLSQELATTEAACAKLGYSVGYNRVETPVGSGLTLRVLHAGESVVARWEFGEIPDEARPFPRLHLQRRSASTAPREPGG